MNRTALVIWLVVLGLIGVPQASAQQWAKKMFTATEHDFGVVARGARAEYEFEFKNLYLEDVHVASIRSSCGCTTARVSRDTLKTGETSQIVAVYNTRSFLGSKSATITVTFDQPYYAEVQLSVSGFIRSDVVFTPGVVDLGEVRQGESVERSVGVAYAGRSDWRIVDVRSANEHFEVELSQAQRSPGRVSYDMLVRLKGDCPPGYIQDQLTILTDDQQSRTITLAVQGHVVPALEVRPNLLFLGIVAPGQTVTKNLVVSGDAPFKILGVSCPADCFEFDVREQDARKLHVIPVTFHAGPEASKIAERIEIKTDFGSGTVVTCQATATVDERKD